MTLNDKPFRKELGFTNKEKLKQYYKATDKVFVNWDKIEWFNDRIKEIFVSLNKVIHSSIRWENINIINAELDCAYTTMRDNNIFSSLNNNGRYPEDVYYNWMRGYIVCKFFAPALASVFNVPVTSIRTVGHDSLTNIETFSRSPVADLEIVIDDQTIRLEIQSGFTGVNDIKEHKVNEAKRAFLQEHIISYVVHFDLFNGTMAIVDITNIDNKSIHWVTRYQMEGKRVFAIPPEAFRWYLLEAPPNYSDILF